MLLLAVGCSEPPTGDRPGPAPDPVEVGTDGLSVRPPGFDPVVRNDVVVADEADLERLRPYVVVEGDLVVEGTSVRTIDLPVLREVGGEVRIWENDALSRISVPSLQSVGGDLTLYDDPLLPDLGGFGALRTVGGSLTLNRLPGLVDLAGLELLESVGRLYLFHDLGLRTLDGLDALQVVDGPVQVWEDHALRELRLPSLRAVTGKLDLFDARALEVLDLPVLADVGALELHHCDALADLRGAFPALTTIPGEVVLQYDGALASLAGLEGLTSVGSLRLEELDALTGTAGLSGLALVEGELAVERCDGLGTLGFDAVTEVRTLEVRLNAGLVDPGLPALRSAAGFRFENNRALPDCAIEALVERVDPPLVACTGNLDAGCATVCSP